MNRYQPAEQIRDGIKVHLIVDTRRNVIHDDVWFSDTLRDAAMNHLNENAAKVRKARQEGCESVCNADATCPYNPDSEDEVERICAEEWIEARDDEFERLVDELPERE